jgi:hypothetical protein
MKTLLLLIATVLTVSTTNSQDTQDFAAMTTSNTGSIAATAFSAILDITDATDLKWITNSENNISHFEVEKSVDGEDYQMAGIVFAYGNTVETVNYRFVDKNIDTKKPAIIYYRLRQVNNNGTTALSVAIPVRTGKSEKGLSIQTYPNPAGQELAITIPSKWQGKKVNVELFNSKGSMAKANTITTSNQVEPIDISNLTPGLYILKVTCNGQTARQKIIKQ